jgi:hypothetical protein
LEGTTVLKETRLILGLASIVTGAALCSGGSRALAAGGASQARSAATAYDFPRPDREEREFGPFDSRREAEQECRWLRREGWHCCIEHHDGQYYVFAWRNRR